MNTRLLLIALGLLHVWTPSAVAQGQGGPGGPPAPVIGGGTAGTLPVWTGPKTLGDSQVFTTQDGALLTQASGNIGFLALTTSRAFNAFGVIGQGPVGVFGASVACDGLFQNCLPSTGIGGLFWAGQGGTLLQGALVMPNGDLVPKLSVTAAGDLIIQGEAFKPGGGSWSSLSDQRTKTDVQPLTDALRRILALRGVTFAYTDAAQAQYGERPGTHVGMVAQEVEEVFPSWVDTASDGYLRVTYRGFEAITVEAIRELNTRLTELERQNADLRAQIDRLVEALDR